MVGFGLNPTPGEDYVEVLTKEGVRKIPVSEIKEFTCKVCGRKVKLWEKNADRAYCSSTCLFDDNPGLLTCVSGLGGKEASEDDPDKEDKG